MLKRKQYLMTLLIAVIMFFVIFIIGYYYVSNSSSVSQKTYEQVAGKNEVSVDVLADTEVDPPDTIQPDTQINLLVFDENNNMIEDKELDALALLGLSESDIKEKFEGYSLLEFSKEQVALKKVIHIINKEYDYTLGIQDDLVCIREREGGLFKRDIPLDILGTHFSKRTYSLLLKEQIKISSLQKDELLNNSNYIEQILQAYEEE